MPKYLISWTEELWYKQEVEADSEEQARDMLFNGEFEWPDPYGTEIQDSVEVEEVNG